jgi:hypothetical protein
MMTVGIPGAGPWLWRRRVYVDALGKKWVVRVWVNPCDEAEAVRREREVISVVVRSMMGSAVGIGEVCDTAL